MQGKRMRMKKKSQASIISVPSKGAADTRPELRLGAHGAPAAGIVILNALLATGVARLANIDVASSADTTVARGLVVSGSAGAELLVEGERRALVGCVGVAGASNATEEAAGRGSLRGRGCGGSCGWEGGDGECVTGAAAAGSDEGG